MAGSAAEARRRPPLSLVAIGERLDAALVFAAEGLPVGGVACVPAPQAPADLAAALVLAHAAALAACAAVQAAAPGAPVFYVAQPRAMGWRLGTAQHNLFALAAGQLAARVGLPFVTSVFTTSSPEPDWQASTENTFAGLSGALARAAVVAGAGLLAGGEIFSCEQLVMDAELFSVVAKIAAAAEVDDETIALETIAKVGIGGNYLSERHTRRHMKEVWRPRLLDRSPWDAWVAGGRQGSYDKAIDYVQMIIDEHMVTPLSDSVAAELETISATGDHGKEPT